MDVRNLAPGARPCHLRHRLKVVLFILVIITIVSRVSNLITTPGHLVSAQVESNPKVSTNGTTGSNGTSRKSSYGFHYNPDSVWISDELKGNGPEHGYKYSKSGTGGRASLSAAVSSNKVPDDPKWWDEQATNFVMKNFYSHGTKNTRALRSDGSPGPEYNIMKGHTYRDSSTGFYHYTSVESFDGLPIINSQSRAHLDAQGNPYYGKNGFFHSSNEDQNGTGAYKLHATALRALDSDGQEKAGATEITASQAVTSYSKSRGLNALPTESMVEIPSPDQTEKNGKVDVLGSGISYKSIKAEKTYYNDQNNGLMKVWMLDVNGPLASDRAIVSVDNGELITRISTMTATYAPIARLDENSSGILPSSSSFLNGGDEDTNEMALSSSPEFLLRNSKSAAGKMQDIYDYDLEKMEPIRQALKVHNSQMAQLSSKNGTSAISGASAPVGLPKLSDFSYGNLGAYSSALNAMYANNNLTNSEGGRGHVVETRGLVRNIIQAVKDAIGNAAKGGAGGGQAGGAGAGTANASPPPAKTETVTSTVQSTSTGRGDDGSSSKSTSSKASTTSSESDSTSTSSTKSSSKETGTSSPSPEDTNKNKEGGEDGTGAIKIGADTATSVNDYKPVKDGVDAIFLTKMQGSRDYQYAYVPKKTNASPLGWLYSKEGDSKNEISTVGNNVLARNPPAPKARGRGGGGGGGGGGDGLSGKRAKAIQDNKSPDGDVFVAGAAQDSGDKINVQAKFIGNPIGAQNVESDGNLLSSISNAFFLSNQYHDIMSFYGFDEKSGNFQDTSTSQNGAGKNDDAVIANVRSVEDKNNAFFNSPPDGISGSLTTLMFTSKQEGGVADPTYDTDVMIHELTHGTTSRLTGGADNPSCLDSRNVPEGAISEGTSDMVSLIWTFKSDDKPEAKRIFTEQTQPDFKIRSQPISTDTKINTHSYADFCTDKARPQCEIHSAGEIWAAMLYEATWNVIQADGFDPDITNLNNKGNSNMLRYIVEGAKLQPCHPTLITSRDAILTAEKMITGGRNNCVLWKGFAKRGLGENAKEVTGKGNGVNNFDLPQECGGGKVDGGIPQEGAKPETTDSKTGGAGGKTGGGADGKTGGGAGGKTGGGGAGGKTGGGGAGGRTGGGAGRKK